MQGCSWDQSLRPLSGPLQAELHGISHYDVFYLTSEEYPQKVLLSGQEQNSSLSTTSLNFQQPPQALLGAVQAD